jgi:hypothetical protein
MVTGTTTLCAGLALEITTVPEYVPAASDEGFAVMLTPVEPNALTLALEGEPESHEPPEVVLACTENDNDPPPRLETEMDCVPLAAF